MLFLNHQEFEIISTTIMCNANFVLNHITSQIASSIIKAMLPTSLDECLTVFLIEFTNLIWAIITVYRVNPEPLGTSIEDHCEWILMLSYENVCKYLNVLVIIQLVYNHSMFPMSHVYFIKHRFYLVDY